MRIEDLFVWSGGESGWSGIMWSLSEGWRIKIFVVLCVAVLCGMLCGCGQRDVLEANGVPRDIEIRFMWDYAEGADVDGMTVYFFPHAGVGRVWRYDVSGRAGGKLTVPSGVYDVIAINNDLPDISLSGTNEFGTLTANAIEVSGLSDVSRATGMLYGASLERVEINGCGVTYRQRDGTLKQCPQGLMHCWPDSLSTVYHVVIEGDKVGTHAAEMAGHLKGLSGGLLVSSALPVGDDTSVLFGFERDGDNEVSGETIDFASSRERTHLSLELTAYCSDGKKYVKVFDVSEQALNSSSPRNVVIILRDINFPDTDPSDDGDVGLDVGVDGWKEVDVTYDTSDGWGN
ncbi:DUF5119 domain-containing protein [Muribaculum intestinale]|uniref:DUF5119 domain-containing protein n=1 Tax=Muribaculum intestinale TaxID=1796646 RepID=UPI0033B5E4C1